MRLELRHDPALPVDGAAEGDVGGEQPQRDGEAAAPARSAEEGVHLLHALAAARARRLHKVLVAEQARRAWVR